MLFFTMMPSFSELILVMVVCFAPSLLVLLGAAVTVVLAIKNKVTAQSKDTDSDAS